MVSVNQLIPCAVSHCKPMHVLYGLHKYVNKQLYILCVLFSTCFKMSKSDQTQNKAWCQLVTAVLWYDAEDLRLIGAFNHALGYVTSAVQNPGTHPSELVDHVKDVMATESVMLMMHQETLTETHIMHTIYTAMQKSTVHNNHWIPITTNNTNHATQNLQKFLSLMMTHLPTHG